MIARYPAQYFCFSSNNKTKWTKEDEDKLMHMIDVCNFSLRKCGDILNRSYSSVAGKRRNLLNR